MSLSRAAVEAAQRCVPCPGPCRDACPVAHESARETLTPRAKMSFVAMTVGRATPAVDGLASKLPSLLGTLAEKARGLVAPPAGRALDAEIAETFYACTGCGQCREACDHDNDVVGTLYAARAEAGARGLAPAGASEMVARVARSGHPIPGDLAAALERLGEENASVTRGVAVLFAGCEAPLRTPSVVAAGLRAAAALRAPLAFPTEALCCGRALLEAGELEGFRDQVQKTWARLGEREVVALSPACARALLEGARVAGVEPRGPVVHITTYLTRHLGPQTQFPALPGRALYHDPCHLGRGLGEYEAPRRLLELALTGGVAEPPRTRSQADCCGATGLLTETFPETARAMAMARADELRAAGGGLQIMTACPSCRTTLTTAGLDVRDVVEMVDEWLQQGNARRSAE
jgi:Fe-S oxidoreductase